MISLRHLCAPNLVSILRGFASFCTVPFLLGLFYVAVSDSQKPLDHFEKTKLNIGKKITMWRIFYLNDFFFFYGLIEM